MMGYDTSGSTFQLMCCSCGHPAGDDAVEVGRDLYCASCADLFIEQAKEADLKRLPTDQTPTFPWSNDNVR